MDLDALVCIGGDGTLAISYEFYKKGIPLVCVPKTIDNDIVGTTSCFGFDTAVSFATDAIDRLHTTAEAHRRIMVVEVMGRYAGWIALHSGVAGGADVILIPGDSLRPREGRPVHPRSRRAGARASASSSSPRARMPMDGSASLIEAAHGGHAERLGGAGMRCAEQLEKLTGKETRYVVLGHLQRGGCADRVRPHAGDAVRRQGGRTAAERAVRQDGGEPSARPGARSRSAKWWGRRRPCRSTTTCCTTARALGVSFGD